jgi:hypothetical protein
MASPMTRRADGSGRGKRPAGNARRVTREDRRRMVSEAAYYKAERRNFRGGDPDRDWFEAELDIEELLDSEGTLQDD